MFDAEEVDRFKARTIADVIEPARNLSIDDPSMRVASETFELACLRFIEVSEDKSSMEGSKWTVLWRLLKGEKVFFRWYDFEDAVTAYLTALDTYSPAAPKELQVRLEAYAQSVHDGFFIEFREQKRVALLMKKLIIGCQVVGLVCAMAIFAFYPITRRHAEETRRLLDERNRNDG